MEDNINAQFGESEDRTRRSFLTWLIASIAFINGLLLGAPFFSSLLGAGKATGKKQWSKIGEVASFPEGKPVEIRFQSRTEEAYLYETNLYSVWVIKNPSGQVTAFSPICTHLGCHYQWDPLTARFECPCHASVFAIDGKVLAGPAPRPLDVLPMKVENGTLFVQMERFRTGVPEKIAV